MIRYARRLGIRSPLEPASRSRSAPTRVSLLELTRAYAVFPNGGRARRARFLRRVLDRRGNGCSRPAPRPPSSHAPGGVGRGAGRARRPTAPAAGARASRRAPAAKRRRRAGPPTDERVLPATQAYLAPT